MKLKGVAIDFDDKKTCGLLPDLCLSWDLKTEELEDNDELIKYWEDNLQKIIKHSDKIVAGNIGTKSIVYSADEETIKLINEVFSELALHEIEYDNILQCENCLKYDYLA